MKYRIILLLFMTVRVYGQQVQWCSDTTSREVLFKVFAGAALAGLEERNYAYETIQRIKGGSLKEADYSQINRELTNAAIAFFSDLAYGKQESRVTYNGLDYHPVTINISDSILAAASGGYLADLPARLEPHHPIYMALKKKVAWLERNKDLACPDITSNQLDSTNHPLIIKLYQLGMTDKLDYTTCEDSLRIQLRKAQREFELLEDGQMRPGVMEELNVPVAKRLYELKHALNTWRWLEDVQHDQAVIIVNIPAANLFYFYNDKVLFYTRCIVGKPATPTTPLTSKVDEILLFPYWNVPRDIAVNEILPAIKSAPLDYLNYGNYQVLDMKGRVVDPATIKWQQLNKHNFNYTLRQLYGCDNSLGIIKLNFYSPYSTYLHDTPNKSYFLFNSRYFSHGCIRVENVDSLAEMLEPALHPFLADAPARICDLAADKGQLIFPLKKKVPLFILYEVAWPDGEGRIRFYDDVYNKVKM